MITIKEYVELRKKELKQEILELKEKYNKQFLLIIFTDYQNSASSAYVKGKLKDAKELGVDTQVYDVNFYRNQNSAFNETLRILQHDLLFSNDYQVGIIIQLPLPTNLKLEEDILPRYDVDGFSKNTKVIPCTPRGIIDYLSYNKYDFEGKNVLVIGRSKIVGRPLAQLLTDLNSNVTICHSHTKQEDLKRYVKNTDLIISAVGKKNLLNKKDFIFNPNSIIIDVGINRDENGKLCGDCEKDLPVKFQSPVPGGVGLLTRLALFENLIQLDMDYMKEF